MDKNLLIEALRELDKDIRRLEFEVLGIEHKNIEKSSDTEVNVPAIKNPALRKMLGVDGEATYTSAMRYYYKRCPYGLNTYRRAAYRLFLLGAKRNGNPKCRFGAALCKYWGHGTQQNHRLAISILTAEDVENITAMANLDDIDAVMIRYQILSLRLRVFPEAYNKDLTESLLHRLTLSYNPLVAFYAAMESRSFPLLERAAQLGSVPAMVELGDIYYYGKQYKPFYTGAGVSIAKAREYYAKGAGEGDAFCKKRLPELDLIPQGFRVYNGVLERFKSNQETVDTVTVPDLVTAIADGAFDGYRITTLILPDSVTYLSESVFLKCFVPKIVSNVLDTKKFKSAVVSKRFSKSKRDSQVRLSSSLKSSSKRFSSFLGSHIALTVTAIVAILGIGAFVALALLF